jgi:hypothetical protein
MSQARPSRARRRFAARLLPLLAAACLAGACLAADPDAPVAHEAPAVPPGAEPPQPVLVAPRAGLAGLRPHPFEEATPIGDGRTLRVRFWGGVAPCFVLGRAELLERADAVTVTLFAGSDPARPDAVCIELAVLMATDVRLSAPLGGRLVRDGAAGRDGG